MTKFNITVEKVTLCSINVMMRVALGAECHYAECRYAGCRYAGCRYAGCLDTKMSHQL
jgi:hypothetical protein